MLYVLCLLTFGAGTYLFHYGFKQKSLVLRIGGSVMAVGAIVLITFFAVRFVGHHNGQRPMCPMMEKMEMMKGMMMDKEKCGCGEVQRPPIGPEKYHQPPMKHLMTDPMESKPANTK